MKSVIKKTAYGCFILSGAIIVLTLYFYCYYKASSGIKKDENNDAEITKEDAKQEEAVAGIEKQYNYKVILEGESINVYHTSDNKVYLYTEIEADTLEPTDRTQLEKGVYMNDLKGLYSYLQTLTS